MSLAVNTFQHRLVPAFIVVVFAAIFCCIAADYSSADNADVEADIEYKVSDDGTYAIASSCKNKETATTAKIAPTYKDVPVTTIGESALHRCTSLISVTIPNSVTTIGEYAFYKCTSLISVTIPNSVTTIGESVFHRCTSLISVTIPNSVTTIGEYAFANCTSLISVTIPNSVTTIEKFAFRECTSLISVTIPNSVTTIGEYAFYKCTSLISVTISNSVTTIKKHAFYECTSLTSVTIPNSVTTIGESVFRECTSLISVTIPNSVTEIGGEAFNCPNLKRIVTTLSFKPGDYGSPSTVFIEVPKSSTIMFNAGEGIGSAPSVTADYGSTTCLPSSGFTREGYTLAAWTTIIDGTIVHYPLGSIYTFRDDAGSTRTFTAHYVANQKTVIFDVNGGTAKDMRALAAATASDGYVQLPNNESFHRSDYTLIGWTPSTGSNVVYPMNYFFPITDTTSTIVMKAVWVPDSTTLCEINFQPNSAQYTNATGITSICKAPAGMIIATPVTGFVFSGYTLSEWNTQPNGKGTAYGLGEGVEVTGSLVLYAQYSVDHTTSSEDHETSTTPEIPTTYTITFNPNGGHAYLASQAVTKDYSVVKPTDPYYPQHAFLGWKISGTTSYYDFTQPVTSDLVLVAQWKKMFDAIVTGATVTITPVGDFTAKGVYVNWGDKSNVEIATVSGLSHKFADNSSGTITVYDNESKSVYNYSVGFSEKESIPDDSNQNSDQLDKLRSFVIGHWLIILLAIIILMAVIRFI